MKTVLLGILAVAVILAVSETSFAGDRHHGRGDIAVSHGYGPVVVAPPVYYHPRPVYYHERPVYVAPRPVYYYERPVYVAPRPAYYHERPVVYVQRPWYSRFGFSFRW